MSKLDQAFIRAYAQPEVAPGATAPPVATAPRAAPRGFTNAERPTVKPVTPAFVEPTAGSLPIAERVMPLTAPAPPAVSQAPALPAESNKKALAPLSHFTAQAAAPDGCRALLEVDRLVWPAACNELMLRAASELERFTQLLVDRTSQGEKCIGITSCQRGEGRTTVCLTAARLLADRGLKIVVVDVDVECPTLVRMCGISASTGWNDLMASELPLGEALITAITDRVTLMPWRGPAASLADLAASGRAATVFGTLREHYDLVLVDTTPLDLPQAINDFSAFATAIHLDALYVVQDVRATPRRELIERWSALRQAGLPLVAAIENFVGEHTADSLVTAELVPSDDRRPLPQYH